MRTSVITALILMVCALMVLIFWAVSESHKREQAVGPEPLSEAAQPVGGGATDPKSGVDGARAIETAPFEEAVEPPRTRHAAVRVVDADGAVVVGAVVQGWRGPVRVASGKTDGSGHWCSNDGGLSVTTWDAWVTGKGILLFGTTRCEAGKFDQLVTVVIGSGEPVYGAVIAVEAGEARGSSRPFVPMYDGELEELSQAITCLDLELRGGRYEKDGPVLHPDEEGRFSIRGVLETEFEWSVSLKAWRRYSGLLRWRSVSDGRDDLPLHRADGDIRILWWLGRKPWSGAAFVLVENDAGLTGSMHLIVECMAGDRYRAYVDKSVTWTGGEVERMDFGNRIYPREKLARARFRVVVGRPGVPETWLIPLSLESTGAAGGREYVLRGRTGNLVQGEVRVSVSGEVDVAEGVDPSQLRVLLFDRAGEAVALASAPGGKFLVTVPGYADYFYCASDLERGELLDRLWAMSRSLSERGGGSLLDELGLPRIPVGGWDTAIPRMAVHSRLH